MQDKSRLYRRQNGMFYAEEYHTRHRESLQTKDEAEARRLIAAKNQAATQPVFNLEMAKGCISRPKTRCFASARGVSCQTVSTV